jgi:hypothetical protein
MRGIGTEKRRAETNGSRTPSLPATMSMACVRWTRWIRWVFKRMMTRNHMGSEKGALPLG